MSTSTDTIVRHHKLSLVGTCGENMDINWDEKNGSWKVDFEYKGNRIRHDLDNKDASACVIHDQWVGLGIEFGQFR